MSPKPLKPLKPLQPLFRICGGMADTLDLGSSSARSVGSSPTRCTNVLCGLLLAAVTAVLPFAGQAVFEFKPDRDYTTAKLVRPRPADFDTYWLNEIARQRMQVPLEIAAVVREPSEDIDASACWDVTVPALADHPVRGWLAIPRGAAAKSLPLIVRFDGHTTTTALRLAYPKAIVFSVNPCGCDNGKDKAYYDRFFGKWDYMHRGWANRDTCWFHGQIMRVVRALEWAKTLPEWNGKDLLVFGKSMGGSQALQAAALDSAVTVCGVIDPALCDHAGTLDLVNPRPSGWPQIYRNAKARPSICDPAKALETSDYYENAFFARRITCQTFFASGLKDRTCPTEGVYLVYRNVRGPKQFVTDPNAWHCKSANRPYEECRDAILKSAGKPMPDSRK